MKKRMLAMALSLCMVLSMTPSMALATEGGGESPALEVSTQEESISCENHVAHDESCGYIAPVTGAECNHVHDGAVCGYTLGTAEVVAVLGVACNQACDTKGEGRAVGEAILPVTHGADCAYVQAVEGVAAVEGTPCNHTAHDQGCGYVETVTGADCVHGCAVCAPVVVASPRAAEEQIQSKGDTVFKINETVIGFAGEEWWVIGNETEGVVQTAGALTLLQKNHKENVAFNGDSSKGNAYSDSDLQNKMNGLYNKIDAKEKALIKPRDIVDGITGAAVNDQGLWALSKEEAIKNHNDGVQKYDTYWWLRSPGYDTNKAAYVRDDGYVGSGSYDVDRGYGVRSALHLNLDSVLFTSAATGGKSGAAGADLSAAVKPTTGAIKLTVKDTAQTVNIDTAKVTQSGMNVSILYSGATTGADQFLSAIVKDGEGTIKYYGKLANTSSAASGTATVTLLGDFSDGWTLQVFSEQINGENETDYASTPVVISSSTKPQATTTNISKATATQAAVGFDLTNSTPYADGLTWKVYTDATGTTTVTGVTASYVGNKLTLAHASDLAVGDYYVSVKEDGKLESNRLKLTVGAPKTATPQAATTSVTKTAATQGAVAFDLTNTTPYADGLTWNVYTTATEATPVIGVTASYASATNKLTLTHASDLAADDYYVSVKESGKLESDRLKLTVGAFVPPAPSSPSVSSDKNKPQSNTKTETETVKNPDGSETTTITAKDVEGNSETKAEITTDQDGNKKAEVVIEAREDSTTATIPKAILDALKGISNVTATVKVSGVEFTLDADVMKQLMADNGREITVGVTPVKEENLPKELQGKGAKAFDIKFNGKDFQFTSVIRIVIDYDKKDRNKTVVLYYLNPNGENERVKGMTWENGVLSGELSHNSQYAIVEETRLTFADVNENDWFYDSVMTTVENGWFSGVSEDLFAPNSPLTRAMLVTVLHRVEDHPDAEAPEFSDVEANQWYTTAIGWGAEKEIVSGYGNGLFGTNDSVTREQLAAIFYRYAKARDMDVSKTASLDGFADSEAVSAYAKEAMSWAVAEGILSARTGNLLAPKDAATRAEAATMLHWFATM